MSEPWTDDPAMALIDGIAAECSLHFHPTSPAAIEIWKRALRSAAPELIHVLGVALNRQVTREGIG